MPKEKRKKCRRQVPPPKPRKNLSYNRQTGRSPQTQGKKQGKDNNARGKRLEGFFFRGERKNSKQNRHRYFKNGKPTKGKWWSERGKECLAQSIKKGRFEGPGGKFKRKGGGTPGTRKRFEGKWSDEKTSPQKKRGVKGGTDPPQEKGKIPKGNTTPLLPLKNNSSQLGGGQGKFFSPTESGGGPQGANKKKVNGERYTLTRTKRTDIRFFA